MSMTFSWWERLVYHLKYHYICIWYRGGQLKFKKISIMIEYVSLDFVADSVYFNEQLGQGHKNNTGLT